MFNLLSCLKIKSVKELDNLYEIIDDHGSWVEIRKKGILLIGMKQRHLKSISFQMV